MRPRLYCDEDFPRQVADALRHLGWDVLTILEDGLANSRTPDAAVLRRAAQLGRVLLTCNRKDFRRLHDAHAGQHGGILTCKQLQGDPALLATRIDEELRLAGDPSGKFIMVRRP